MSKLRQILVVLLGLCAWLQGANAVGPISNFKEQFDGEFFGFQTIEPSILKEIVTVVPAQSTIWSCGLQQCGYVLECANRILGCERELGIDYTVPGKYPLAIDVNIHRENLARILNTPLVSSFIGLIRTDDYGNFRIGATPHEMSYFINDHLPGSFKFGAKAISVNQLSIEELILIVRSNVEKSMPTLAYYVVDENNMLMHVYGIVGYREDGSDSELVVLDTIGEGVGRFKKMNAIDFVDNMNAGQIIGLVNKIDVLGRFLNLRETIADDNGRVVSKHILKEWKPFSLITFVEKDLLTPRMEGDRQKETAIY